MTVKDKNYKEPSAESVITEKENGDFVIGQRYEDKPAKTLFCKRCGTNKFVVGQNSYFTAIKCEKCDYQLCIHNG